MAISLAEQQMFDWSEFQQELIQSIAEAEQADSRNPSRGYYESWLTALEKILARKQLLDERID